MAQSSILELAKQGNSEAIATLINRSIQAKGITASAFLDQDSLGYGRLNIDLRSPQKINQKPMVSLIQKGMLNLQVKGIQNVIISAFQSDYETASDRQIWQVNLNLDSTEDFLKELPQSAPNISASTISATKVELNSELSSGTLVYQPVPIKHIPQSYQDIIIRFIDCYGNPKCLCTLSELIEVINNFNFGNDNPALKNLLEAIAESTTIDDNGDRLITNISVLQPSSQWQRAKIRLVVNIFFESESDVSPTESSISSISEIITLEAIETPASTKEKI